MKNTKNKCECCGAENGKPHPDTNTITELTVVRWGYAQEDGLKTICQECYFEYMAKRNRRRYKLHYKCRRNGNGVDIRQKTCSVLCGSIPNKFTKALIDEFNYEVQYVMYIDDKRAKLNKEL